MPGVKSTAIFGLLMFNFLTAAPVPAQTKDKVQRSVSSARLEGILKDMNIKYEKTAGKEEGIHFYDFERNTFRIRLHNYQGKDLWIDVRFNDQMTLKEINEWNIRAKFSRAVLIKEGDKQSTSLEAQIDCLGGITDGMIRQFILRFDGEIKSFVQFLTK
jgi:Putative bacterial sensory transduction regulator